MICNAIMLRIDTPAAATVTGREQWTAGAAINVGCTVDDPDRQQQFAIGQLKLDATAVLYVYVADATLVIGARVVVRQGDQSDCTYIIRSLRTRSHGGQSHYECFVREAT